MNPMRRTALRAAASAARVPTIRSSMFGIAAQIPTPSAARIAAPVAIRCFSQTFCVAQDDAQPSEPSSQPQNQTVEAATTSEEAGFGLFVRNMVFEANEDHLKEAYEKYGEILRAVVARDARGLSRGYGFVWFSDKSAMEQAVEGTNNSFWHGRRIQVAPRTARTGSRSTASRGATGPTRSLYIGNIPYETTDAELNRIFRELKNVTDVRVAVDRTTGWPRGFAHADFVDVEAATEGIKKLQGITIGGRELRLDYAAEPQYQRK